MKRWILKAKQMQKQELLLKSQVHVAAKSPLVARSERLSLLPQSQGSSALTSSWKSGVPAPVCNDTQSDKCLVL